MKHLNELPLAVHEQLVALGRRRWLAPGETVIQKGSRPTALVGVVSGRLHASSPGRQGREAMVALLWPGQWFGEVSLLQGKKHGYDVVAECTTEVVLVAADIFLPWVQSDTQRLMAFTQLVCERLRTSLAWMDGAMLEPLPVRLAQLLLDLRNQAGMHAEAPSAGAIDTPQEDLAAMLGVSRQTVNRLLRSWASQGLLDLRYGRMALLDEAGLRECIAREQAACELPPVRHVRIPTPAQPQREQQDSALS